MADEILVKSMKFPGLNSTYIFPSIDDTLSLEDRAADAKAVGDALANKAPAGYGLGDTSKRLTNEDDLNSVVKCGFYAYDYNKIPVNGISISSPFQYTYHLIVSREANGTIVQEITTCGATPSDANYRLRRVKGFGEWSEWEWVNPPMEVGVDYRTTERWNGKPVYVRFMDLGKIPKNTHKSVNWTSDENAQVISVRGVVGLNYNDLITVPNNNFNGAVGTFSLKGQRNLITMYTDYDYGDMNLYAELRYILIGG